MNQRQIVLAVCAVVAFSACAPTSSPSTPPPAPPAPTTTPAPPANQSPSVPTELILAQFTNYSSGAHLTDQGGVIYDYKYAGKADCSPGGDSGGAENFPTKIDSSANQPASIRYTFTIPKGNCYAGAGVGFFANDAQSVVDLSTYSKLRVYLASSRGRLAVYLGKCFAEVSTTATLTAYTLNLDAFKGDGCVPAQERSQFKQFQVQDSTVGVEGATNAIIQIGEVSFIK